MTGIRAAVARWRHAHDSVVGGALAFLHESYRDSAWWFEGVVLARRVAIAAFASVLPRGSVFVAPLLLGTLLSGIFAVFVKRPYASQAAHKLELATLAATAFSLSIVTDMSDTDAGSSIVLGSIFFIIVNGAVLAVAAVYVALPLLALAAEAGSKRRSSLGTVQ